MLNPIYANPSPTWAERAAKCAMTANSFDTPEDAELADRIEDGTATQKEVEYYRGKYGNGPGGSC